MLQCMLATRSQTAQNILYAKIKLAWYLSVP